LEGQFSTRCRERFRDFARRLVISLHAIVNLERRCAVQDERCGHACVP
jgi:hypothetical protein